MKVIAVFGASGATGKDVVQEANNRGIQTRSFVRKMNSSPVHSLNTEIQGLFNDHEAVKQVIEKVDGIIIVLGARAPYKDVFCTKATTAIVDSAKANGIKRLICQTGALIGEYPDNQRKFFKNFGRKFDKSHPEIAEDRVQQENVIKESNLMWTIVKPPRLTNGNKMGHFKCAPDIKVGLFSKISRRDLSCCLVDLVDSNRFSNEVVFIK